MRLTELEPRWIADRGMPEGTKQGVSFLCPHCRVERLAVFFTPTICGAPPVDITAFHHAQLRDDEPHLGDEHVGRILWTRSAGDTFETLTLTPSIDASRWGCWHGYITDGAVR